MQVSRKSLANAIATGATEYAIKEKIHHEIVERLRMNIVGKDAEQFLDFVFIRSKHGEDITKFTIWWIQNNPDPKYWSFGRMMQMWPQAFREEDKENQIDFLSKWDKNFAPPPE